MEDFNRDILLGIILKHGKEYYENLNTFVFLKEIISNEDYINNPLDGHYRYFNLLNIVSRGINNQFDDLMNTFFPYKDYLADEFYARIFAKKIEIFNNYIIIAREELNVYLHNLSNCLGQISDIDIINSQTDKIVEISEKYKTLLAMLYKMKFYELVKNDSQQINK